MSPGASLLGIPQGSQVPWGPPRSNPGVGITIPHLLKANLQLEKSQ